MPFPIAAVLDILEQEVKDYKVPVVDLIKVQTNDPLKVLLATILSARTKDETTAAACKRLFVRVKKIEDLRTIPLQELEQLIYPVGFYKNKSLYLKQLPQALEQFPGKIPDSVEDLLHLPGVGRKTANLVVAVAFQKPAICVDVHVHRIMNRLGYVKTTTPFETEMILRKKLPSEYWLMVNKTVVAFGQHLCKPVRPHCDVCPVYKYCKRVGVTPRRKDGR
ncbi:endonuclease III [Candidatus Woesearchaeota archaeon]|nr:endonuclease III [Candidatus Woesearchaeota archaeon]